MPKVGKSHAAVLAALILVLLPWPALASAFRLTLTDGREVVGTVTGFEDGVYSVTTGNGARLLRLDTVKSIEPLATTTSIDPAARVEQKGAFAPAPEFTFATTTSKLIVGRLTAFEDGVYEIQTRSGTVRLRVEEVRRVEVAWVERPPLPQPSGQPLARGAIRIAGADAMATLHVPALVEAYSASGGGRDPLWSRGTRADTRTFSVTARNGKFTATVRNAGSVPASDALLRGEADAALLSRRMLPEEARKAQERGIGNPLASGQEFELAPGGAVILVHPSNPVKALRHSQIVDILAGRIRSWGDVGGTPRRIQVHALEEGTGTLDVVRAKLMGGEELVGTIKRVSSNIEMADIIASDQAAIGIAEYAFAGNATPLALIDDCGRAIGPDEFSLQTQEYFLSSPLYLYLPSKPTPEMSAFAQFALSPEGQRALSHAGLASYLPIAVPRAPVEPDRFAGWPRASEPLANELARFMTRSARVSVSVGYLPSGAALEPGSDREIARLVAHMKNDGAGKSLVLFGHADATSNLRAAARISERGAQLLEQKLKERAIAVERIFGLGPMLPLSCGKTPEAKASNYRVEAWIH